MGDEHDRPVGEHAPERLPQRGQHGDVERSHGLVEQEQGRVGGKGPGHRDALGLAARELTRSAPGELSDSDLVQPVLGVPSGRRVRRTGAPWPERDVLQGVEVGEEQRLLPQQRGTPGVRGHAEVRPARPDVGQHPAVELDPARLWHHESSNHAERGGLARPVGTEQCQGLAGRDLDGKVDVPLGKHAVHRERHSTLRLCRANPITSTATMTRTRASATAASGSVSRWR